MKTRKQYFGTLTLKLEKSPIYIQHVKAKQMITEKYGNSCTGKGFSCDRNMVST